MTIAESPSFPWPMVGTCLGSLSMTIVYFGLLARSKWPTGIRAACGAEERCGGNFVSTGPWSMGLVKDVCAVAGSSGAQLQGAPSTPFL